MGTNSPKDKELRQRFENLEMPSDANLYFDRTRWTQITQYQRPSPLVGPHKFGRYGFLGAAVILAAALIGTPVALKSLTQAPVAPAHLKPLPSRIYPWHRLGFVAMHMISPTAGWGFASSGTTVYRSVNGPGYWKLIGTTGPSKTGDIAISVLNLRDAFYVTIHNFPPAVTVGRTTDGGRQWSRTTFRVPEHFGTKKFFSGALATAWLNPSVGAVLLGGGTTHHGITGERLYMSNNGGKSWTLRAQAGKTLPGSGLLSLSQGQQVWLLIGSTLWHSVNAGSSWHRERFGQGAAVSTLGVPAFNAAGTNGAVAVRVGTETIVYTTHNGGLSWQPTTPITTSAPLTLFRLNQKDLWLWAVSYAPRSHSKEVIWSSTNGGQSWHNQGVPRGVPAHNTTTKGFGSYQFVSPQIGFSTWYLNGQSSYYESQDGGKVWTPVIPKARLSKKQLVMVNGILKGP